MVDSPHKDTFKNGNREWQFIPTQVKFRNQKNAEKTDEQRAARVGGLLEKEKEKRTRLKELGIEYDFPGFQAIVDAAAPGKSTKSKSKAPKVEEVEKEVRKSSRKSSVDKTTEKIKELIPFDKKNKSKSDKSDSKSKKSKK